ncbi:uncharacterized protein EI97DRAFT_431413 [Westerdykella ornata]|uniref:Uncharacterized protein n=1 Tax=Westerdykella ornata TaxID=318751 RepID=A0A6A6JNE6_WESOR|nr:uncharacterized protein EI97DRAFT_431413 [Westerdykella ornata]KAF2278150.1 hypothetical protein EI97DRAFT_431413 [Westerdykella ornata]
MPPAANKDNSCRLPAPARRAIPRCLTTCTTLPRSSTNLVTAICCGSHARRKGNTKLVKGFGPPYLQERAVAPPLVTCASRPFISSALDILAHSISAFQRCEERPSKLPP